MFALQSAGGTTLAATMLCAAAVALTPAMAASNSKKDVHVESTAVGAYEYRTFCASCHGAAGKGDGPLAPMLKIEPSNLTTLSQGNGGKFPRDRLLGFIDGRNGVAAHGSRDMPVWGDWFNQHTLHDEIFLSDAMRDLSVKARISGLVTYIESLQSK